MGRLARVAPALAAVLLLGAQAALPATTLAKGVVYPPGNSGVSQYEEDLPTVHGGRPTNSIVAPANGSGSGGSGSALAQGSSGTEAATVIPSAVIRKLSHAGNAGKAAAALAEATAQAPATSVPARRASSPQAPATSVIKALAGTTGGGGLGALLPAFLIAALVVVSAVGLFQRRRST